MLTVIKVMKKWAFSHFGFMFTLKIRGNQWVAPARIANTAPIDNT